MGSYEIVPPKEADILKRKVSINSPFGRAVLGQSENLLQNPFWSKNRLRDFENQVGKGFLSETLPETNFSVAIGVFNEKLFLKIDQTAKNVKI